MSIKNKVLLIILDGFGAAPKSEGNAVVLAQPENLTKLWSTYPRTYLDASGEDVGLLENTNGNSEVGHLTIGSGKIHYQNLLKINNSIKKGLFFSNSTLKNLLHHSLKNNSRIHLMGCLSDGSVHSHIDHFIAVLEFLSREGFKGEVLIHAFTDGRDTPQKAAKKYFIKLQNALAHYRIGRIASICGRAYAMDRNNITERTKKAYDLLTKATGIHFKNWEAGIDYAYNEGQTDEYIEPTSIFQTHPEESIIKDNDSILFMNFRPDRALQLTIALQNSPLKNIFLTGMVEYQKNFPQNIIFPKEYLSLPLGRVISEAGLKQIRIAESEKYPHVTYFFNGGQPIQYPGEERIRVPSPKVATYDLKPEMSAYEILTELNKTLSLNSTRYDFATVNIANGDMVGHTGNLEAGIKAVKTVDQIVKDTIKLAKKYNWTTIITADHGNIERMIDPNTRLPNTEHTQNPVPLILIDDKIRANTQQQLKLGTLSDIAPTILKIMGLEIPSSMTGRSLI